jgi:hypothetical protein
MTTDLTIGLLDRPGSLAGACDTLGRAGINIDGACGFVSEGRGTFHVLVADATRAERALIDAGFEILARRQVAVLPVEDRPGAAAELLRRIAAAGVNVDLLYSAVDGRMVLAGDDLPAIRAALG